MSEVKYMLVAYKSNWDDYCMGCHMGSTDSDYDIVEDLSEDELVKKIANFEVEGYETHYFIQPPDISWEDADRINDQVRLYARKIKIEKEEERQRLIKQREVEEKEKIKRNELEWLERLKEKYE